jgi:diguanylate cyclase (GGDEF)-like protein
MSADLPKPPVLGRKWAMTRALRSRLALSPWLARRVSFSWLVVAWLVSGLALPTLAKTLDPTQQSLSQLRVETWQTEQGLPLNTVQGLHQTQSGHLWVGTAGGIARFDGVRFTTFESAAVQEISGRAIFGMLQDSEGWLWIGTHNGAVRYRDGRFERVFGAEFTDRRRVWSFAQQAPGTVWVATENGLIRWEAGKGVTRTYKVADGLPSLRLRSLAFDRDGTLWIGTTGGGLVAKRGEVFTTYGVNEGLPHREVRQVLPAPDGAIWATTAGGGLARWFDGRFTVWTTADGLPSNQLTSMALDRHGALWLGTWGAGIVRFKDGRFTSLATSGGLAGDQIWSLMIDREDNIWVGTWVGGLNRLRAREFTVIGKPEGLAHDNARSVLRARDGAMWVATAGGGVSRVSANGIMTLDRSSDGLPSNETSALFEDTDGSLWIGTYTDGLVHYRDGKLIRYTGRDGLPGQDIRAVLRDREGTLWVATTSGLARRVGDRFEAIRDVGVPPDGITCLAEGKDGTLWMGSTGSGVTGWRAGKVTSLTRSEGLLTNWVLALHVDKAGALWIGTGGEGLSRYVDGKLAHVRPADGLWDGTLQVILDDGRGHYWFTSNRGFFKVLQSELQAVADGRAKRVNSVGYGPGDALRSTTFAGALQPAGAVDAKGRLWLPSFNSVVVVEPDRLPGSAIPPTVAIDEVLLAGKPLSTRETLKVPAGNVPITLKYFANTLRDATRVRFRYRMDGLTDDWVNLGPAREMGFPALPHGSYTFRLAASVDGIRWSEREATLPIVVAPHFYLTPAFIAAIGITLAFAGYMIYWVRTRRLRIAHAEMEKQVAEKTEALRLANEHLLRLSNQDALTGLANRRRLNEVLDQEWRRAARGPTALALIMVDIDHFKALNDSLGHPEGDHYLEVVGRLIAELQQRPGDCAGRYGGEEFLLILPETNLEGALHLAERLRAACEARALPHPASPVSAVMTISLGVAAAIPDESGSPAHLLAEADAALYRAKLAGRNRVSE